MFGGITVAAAVVLAAISAARQPLPPAPETYTLERCLREARELNPELRTFRERLARSTAQRTEAEGRRLPSVLASAGVSRFSPAGAGQLSQVDLSLTVSQPLYRGGGLRASITAAGLREASTGFQLETAEQDLALSVTRAFYGYLNALRLLDVAERSLDQAALYLSAAEARFDLGVSRRADVLRATVAVSDAELERIEADRVVLLTRGELNRVIGRPVDAPLDAVEPPDDVTAVPELRQLGDMVTRATRRRPEMRAMEQTVEALAADVRATRAERLPRVSLDAGWNAIGDRVTTLESGWSAGVVASISVYDGRQRQARVAETQALLRQAKAEQADLRQAVEQSVWNELVNVRESAERVHNAAAHLDEARENLAIAEGEYMEGVGSMLELTDARNTLVDAERRHINLSTEHRLARATLQRALGAGSR